MGRDELAEELKKRNHDTREKIRVEIREYTMLMK